MITVQFDSSDGRITPAQYNALAQLVAPEPTPGRAAPAPAPAPEPEWNEPVWVSPDLLLQVRRGMTVAWVGSDVDGYEPEPGAAQLWHILVVRDSDADGVGCLAGLCDQAAHEIWSAVPLEVARAVQASSGYAPVQISPDLRAWVGDGMTSAAEGGHAKGGPLRAGRAQLWHLAIFPAPAGAGFWGAVADAAGKSSEAMWSAIPLLVEQIRQDRQIKAGTLDPNALWGPAPAPTTPWGQMPGYATAPYGVWQGAPAPGYAYPPPSPWGFWPPPGAMMPPVPPSGWPAQPPQPPEIPEIEGDGIAGAGMGCSCDEEPFPTRGGGR